MMNKIYKIIRSRKNGQIVVTSELAKNPGITVRTGIRKIAIVATLSINAYGAYADTFNWNSSSDYSSGLTYDSSALYPTSTSSLNELNINGDIASNVYGAYDVNIQTSSDANGSASTTESNVATTYVTITDSSSHTSTENRVTIQNNTQVTGDAIGGYTAVSAVAGNATTSGTLSDLYGYAYATAGAVTTASGATLTSQNNSVVIKDGSEVTGNVIGGYTAVSAVAGNATAGGVTTTASGLAFAYASTDSKAYANSATLIANENNVVISNSTVRGNLIGGYITILASDGNAQGGTATTNSSNQNADAYANDTAYVYVRSATVSADSNEITVEENSQIDSDVKSGYIAIIATGGNAIAGNTTNLTNTNSHASASAYIDARSSNFTAAENIVSVKNSTVTGSVMGGNIEILTKDGSADGGDAQTSSSGSYANAYAHSEVAIYATSASFTADSNEVSIDNSTISNNIFGSRINILASGGSVQGGNATNNVGAINNTASGNAYANSSSSNASSTITATGSSTRFSAKDNVITISSGNVNGDVITGGDINISAVGGSVDGGTATSQISVSNTSSSVTANANANASAIANATMTITGGVAFEADNNSIEMTDSSNIAGNAIGGNINISAIAGTADGGTATAEATAIATNSSGNNSSSATATANATATASATIDATDATLSANSNIIKLSDSTVSGDVIGGYINISANGGAAEGGTATATAAATSSNASATTTNTEIETTTATSSTTINLSSATLTVNNNNVNLSNSTVSGNVVGGNISISAIGGSANSSASTATADTIVDISSTSISASNNNINISNNSSVSGNIIGGYVGISATSGSANNINGNVTMTTDDDTKVFATNNTITIDENISLANTTNLYGGYGGDDISAFGSGTYNYFSGNTLNIAGRHSVSGIYNFENLAFTLPEGFTSSDVLISADTVNLDLYDSGNTSTVTAINSVGNTSLIVGETYTLIQAQSDIEGTLSSDTASGYYYNGVAFISTYEWEDVVINGTDLTATLKSNRVEFNPQTHAFMQGRTASLALLKQGGDLLAEIEHGKKTFVYMHGGSSRYKTGSHLDLDSFTVLAGGSDEIMTTDDFAIHLGGFIEYGIGSYDSYNRFAGLSSVKGSGDTDFVGVGLTTALDHTSGFYADGTFRIGRVQTDMKSNLSANARYDKTKALYLGGHLQAGWIFKITEKDRIKTYGRYTYTYMDSDNVMIDGDKYHFSSGESHRFRFGMRYDHQLDGIMPFAGLAYEYEADGKAKGSVLGNTIKPTDIGGSTVIGELGLSWVPESKDNIQLDISIEGYAGKREGFMGNMRFNYHF